MRARLSKIGQGDSLESGYGLFDDDAPVFSSGTPWFAFDTMDFRLFDGEIVKARAMPALRAQSLVDSQAASAASAIDYSAFADAAAVALPASGVRSLMAGSFEWPARQQSDFSFDDSKDGLMSVDAAVSRFDASVATANAASAVPIIGQIFSGALEFPEGANIEAGFSVLDLVNIAPSTALNQGDTFYMFDQGESFSLARIQLSGDTMFDAGRDPFELTSYLIGDTDNDGINDFVIRIDKGGPTLLGTDFII